MSTFDQLPPDEGEFQDPLENYDPPVFDDPLEQALHEETVLAIQSQPYASISCTTTVADALQKLAGQEISCLLVEDQGKLVGVFSDRDLLNKVALEYETVKDSPVSNYMTNQPIYVDETDSAAAALSVMAVSGFRHVPIVDLQENLVGIVSPQRVTKFLRAHMHDQVG